MARFYISILEGDSPSTAVPVVASEDPTLVRAVARALLDRLSTATGPLSAEGGQPSQLLRVLDDSEDGR